MTTQSVARSNRHNVHLFVASRRPFRGSNMSGRTGFVGRGQLPQAYVAAFEEAMTTASDFYVVQSYETPIAWFANGQWWVPNVRYSPTTSRQQSALRLVTDGSVWKSGTFWAVAPIIENA